MTVRLPWNRGWLLCAFVAFERSSQKSLLRDSGDVLAEVEHRDVVLRRRDGEDLFLGLRSREASVRDALRMLARLLLAASVDPKTRQSVAGALALTLAVPEMGRDRAGE